MPLKVVTGRANAGKTGRILGWAAEALAEGGSPTLIVPGLADVRRLQVELSGKMPLGVRVSTERAFNEEAWQLHGDGRRFVEDATRFAVMRRLIERCAAADLSDSAGAPGFERLMLQMAGQCPPFPSEPAAGGDDGESLVVELLRLYRAELGRLNLIEAGWVGPLLAENPPMLGFLGALHFNLYSPAQVGFLCALSKRSAVCVALDWQEGFAPTAASDAVAAVLLAAADEVYVAEEPSGVTELSQLSEQLFGGPAAVQPSGQVVLGEAAGSAAEAALAAGLAGAAVRSGMPADRIAIVFPHVAPRVGQLRNSLTAEGLRAEFDYSLTVQNTSFGRALAALLAIALGRGARAEALEFLQGPYGDIAPESVLKMDAGWRSGRRGDDSRAVLGSLIDNAPPAGAASLARRVARGRLDEEAAQEWQKLADQLIASGATARAEGLPEVDAGAHRAVTRAVAQMAAAPGHPFDAADVLDALQTMVCATPETESADCVQVVQSGRFGSRRFDMVIVGGLTRAETPGTHRESFVSEIGSRVSGRSRATAEAQADQEFYSLVTRARSRLALVRQTVGSDGVVQMPSPLLEAVIEAYRSPVGVQDPSGPPISLPEVVRCEDARAFGPVFTVGRREARLLSEDLIPVSREVNRGVLDPALSSAAVADRVFSATEIEEYIACPYRWFYSRVIRPQDIDSGLDAATLGSRAHRLIAEFYGALAAQGISRVTAENLRIALEVFDSSAAQSERDMSPTLTLGEEIDAGRALLWARHVVEDDAEFLTDHAPWGHEVDFGRDTQFEFAGVRMAGRIDRIDAGPGGIVVTDYKSARDVGKLARPGDGLGIQHVIYAVAAQELVDLPVQGSVYRSLRTRRLRGFWREDLFGCLPDVACSKDSIDEAGFEVLIDTVSQRVATAVEGMAAGRIPRTPRAAASCTYCGLSAICEGAKP